MNLKIVFIVIVILSLSVFGLYKLYKKSRAKSHNSPSSPLPLPSTLSDCGYYHPKCKKEPDSCKCPDGQIYACSIKQCVTNCKCDNGTPSGSLKPNIQCGKIYQGKNICETCNTGYALLNNSCALQCGQNNHGTCKGVDNRDGTGTHNELDQCCLCGLNSYKCCARKGCGRADKGGGTGCNGDTRSHGKCKRG